MLCAGIAAKHASSIGRFALQSPRQVRRAIAPRSARARRSRSARRCMIGRIMGLPQRFAWRLGSTRAYSKVAKNELSTQTSCKSLLKFMREVAK